MGDVETKQVMMRTPSGKLVPFAEWVKGMRAGNLFNDIKKMLILTNKEVARLSAMRARGEGGALMLHPEARAALEQTYFVLLVLIADTSQPIPVDNEVEVAEDQGSGTVGGI